MLSVAFQDQVPGGHSYWDGKGVRQEKKSDKRYSKKTGREVLGKKRTLDVSSHGVKGRS